MRITRPVLVGLTTAALTLFLLIVVTEPMARGPGGGRGGGPRGGGPRGGHRMGGMHHHRMGPASGGSFASRPGPRSHSHRPAMRSSSPPYVRRPEARSPRPRQPAAVPPPTEEMQEKREYIDKRQAARENNARDEHWDHWRHRRYREELGTTYSSDYFDDDDCEAEVVVDGITYYNCDGVWYRRAYSGGTVNYVVVEGPRRE